MYSTAKMPAANKPIYSVLIVLICLFAAVTAQAAGIPANMLRTETGRASQIPKGLSPNEVDAYLAGLSDEQARQVLAHKLKQEASDSKLGNKGDAAEGDDAASTIFYELASAASNVADHIASFFSAGESSSLKWGAIFSRLSGGKGAGHLLMTVFIGLILIVVGLLVERLFLRMTDGLRQQILNTVALGKLQKLGRFFSRLLLDALGVGVFILTTFILFIIIFRQEDAGYWIVGEFLMISYYFLVIRFAAKMIMSPASAPLRLLPLQDRDAIFLYRWIIRISMVAAIFDNPQPHISEHRPQRSTIQFIFHYIGSQCDCFDDCHDLA